MTMTRSVVRQGLVRSTTKAVVVRRQLASVKKTSAIERSSLSLAAKTKKKINITTGSEKILADNVPEENKKGFALLLENFRDIDKETDRSKISERVTSFQFRVYQALCQVPKGKVTTYKDLATSIDCASNQAVGQALKRNPFAPAVPCHRVVASDYTIGGFFGCRTGTKLDEKVCLLQTEGVQFLLDKNGVSKIDPQYIFSYD